MNTELTGKVILITGASGGIGSAIARSFAAESAKLVVHYHSHKAKIMALQRELNSADSFIVGGDLSREAMVKHVFKAAVKRFGRVDTLVANAASWEVRDVPLHKMSLRHWQQTMQGVLTTAFLTVREFMRLVQQQKQGNAVLISSTAALFGEAGHTDYASGKAALAYGFLRSLKNEFPRIAPHTREYCGGRINCVCPGWTVVPRLATKLRDPAMVRRAAATMALAQLARPEDIANAVVFLASDALARHITGQVLMVAGGMEGRQLWEPSKLDPGSM
jgi:3-oxoacyl-[acyl-carrier protein] reductase